MTEPPGQNPTGSPDPGSPDAERDAETARLLLASDQAGLRRLVEDHASRVRSTLQADFRKVLDYLEIDDALSQATQRVWKYRQRIDLSRGTLRAWYYSIARNCSLRLLTVKRGPNVVRATSNLDLLVRRRESENGAAAAAATKILYEAIDRLPGQLRAVMRADLAAGGTADTELLMAQLNTTAGNIYVARTTGRKRLREILTAMGYPPKEDVIGEAESEVS